MKTDVTQQQLPGELVVGIVRLPDGKLATVWFCQPKAAIRHMAQAMEDLRDQIYAEKDTRIVAPPMKLV